MKFTEFRSNLLKCWMGILKTKQIPFTNQLNIINMLVESSTVSEWTLQVFIENACSARINRIIH